MEALIVLVAGIDGSRGCLMNAEGLQHMAGCCLYSCVWWRVYSDGCRQFKRPWEWVGLIEVLEECWLWRRHCPTA
jgi:hypothetical protein